MNRVEYLQNTKNTKFTSATKSPSLCTIYENKVCDFQIPPSNHVYPVDKVDKVDKLGKIEVSKRLVDMADVITERYTKIITDAYYIDVFSQTEIKYNIFDRVIKSNDYNELVNAIAGLVVYHLEYINISVTKEEILQLITTPCEANKRYRADRSNQYGSKPTFGYFGKQ